MNPCPQPSAFALVCATVSDSQGSCLCYFVWQPGGLYWFHLSVLLCLTARCSCLCYCVWQPGALVCATVSDSQVLLSVLLWQPGLLFVLLCLTARWTLLIPPVCATVPDSQMLLSVLLWQPGLLSVLLCLAARCSCLGYCVWQPGLLSVLLCLTVRWTLLIPPVCASVSDSQVNFTDSPCTAVSDSQVNFTNSTCTCCSVWQPGELYWFPLYCCVW